MMTLYDMELSGNCYKVRLLASLLGMRLERIAVNLRTAENRSPTFLALNPRGEIPVLVDGDTVVWDSHAILVYLAGKHDGGHWYPDAPAARARVQQWMAVAAHEIQYGVAAARAVSLFGRQGDIDTMRATGTRALELIDRRLGDSAWLAGDQVSLADVACYPYLSCAPDGGFVLDAYPHILRWFHQLRSLDGYTPMTQCNVAEKT